MFKSGNSLAHELETHRSRLPERSARERQFVLVRGSEGCGFHEEYVKAVTAGHMRYGIMPFFVTKVTRQQNARRETRLFASRLAR